MKRLIRASKYSDKAVKHEKNIGRWAEILADVVNSTTSEELSAALAPAGKWFSDISTKKEAIKAIVDQIDNTTSDYLIESNADAALPEIRDKLEDFLKLTMGYDFIKLSKPPKGFDEAYVLERFDDATPYSARDSLREAASAVAKFFHIKPDTGIIGGSWTSYEFKLNGVAFRIGFEPDYDEDPTGDTRSLQIGF